MLIPLLLLAAFLILPLLDEEKKPTTKYASAAVSKFPATGFPDYDLLPEELKQRMEELVKEDTLHRYSFSYFFEVDDINRHYYLDDNPGNIIVTSVPVTKQETLMLVDERLERTQYGFRIEFHPDAWKRVSPEEAKMLRNTAHRRQVEYVFPEEEADFRQLRVGILKDTLHTFFQRGDRERPDTETYSLQEVDQTPVPVRGWQYFHDVLRKSLKDKFVYFNFYDMEGEVTAEFSIGSKASSPQIIEGFSTRETDRDEAYKLDGLIVKALNSPKVRWRSGTKNGKPVNTRVAMRFHFSYDGQGELDLTLSDLHPATKSF